MAYSDKHGFNKIRIYSLKELYKYLRNLRLKMLIDALSFIDSGDANKSNKWSGILQFSPASL